MLEEFEKEKWERDHYKRHPKSRIGRNIVFATLFVLLLWRIWAMMRHFGVVL